MAFKRRRKRKSRNANDAQMSLFDNISLGIQETTMQVPCGANSMADPSLKVPEFVRSVYWWMNYKSNWERGETHPLSNASIAKSLGVKCKSQVHRAIKWLIQHEWIEVLGKRGSDGAFFYKIKHHNCEWDDVPRDPENEPLKCAVPIKANSGFDLIEKGIITWRTFNQWIMSKIQSDWTTGYIEMTIRKMNEYVRFGFKTIGENIKKLLAVGLLNKEGRTEYQIRPKPYPERRERQKEQSFNTLPRDGDWYYSYNRLWRFHAKTLRLMMNDYDGRWRDTDMNNLLSINRSIHADFSDYMDAIYERMRTD